MLKIIFCVNLSNEENRTAAKEGSNFLFIFFHEKEVFLLTEFLRAEVDSSKGGSRI